jgi:hypothetical protein
MKPGIRQSFIRLLITEGTCGRTPEVSKSFSYVRQQDSEKARFIPLKAILTIVTTFITSIIFSYSYKLYII